MTRLKLLIPALLLGACDAPHRDLSEPVLQAPVAVEESTANRECETVVDGGDDGIGGTGCPDL